MIEKEPRYETVEGFKLVGMKMPMSFANNQTRSLWQAFMPKRKEITRVDGPELYSVEVYPGPGFFNPFDPQAMFEKWAAVKATGTTEIPDGMEILSVPLGMYATFHFKGGPHEAPPAYQYIYGTWLPRSGYALDDRPHFAVMGEKYKFGNPDSEEDIWIPVKSIR